MYLKDFLKRHPVLLDLVACIYSLPFIVVNLYSIVKGRLKIRGSFLRSVKVYTKGNCRIIIDRRARLYKCRLLALGDGCTIHIGGCKTLCTHGEFYCADENSCIIIGEDFTFEGGHIAATEGRKILVGKDCMFSSDIEIRNGDSHAILAIKDSSRVNQAQDVSIGDHVWLCAHVRVLKGSDIPSYSIIGNSAIVSGKLTTEYGIYSGSPASLLKYGYTWDRQR